MTRNPGVGYSATVAANGTASIRVSPNGIHPWSVDQVSTEYADAPLGAVTYLRRNGNLITYMIATGDVADGAPAVVLNPGDVMTIEWTGADPGDLVKAWITYDDGV
jgi:hypothetical protein